MPPSKQRIRRSATRADPRIALAKRLSQIHADLAALKRERAAMNRNEFDEMSKSLQQLRTNTDDIATQFTRIAQMQAQLDAIVRALKRAQLID
jgi:hypothetical protein